MRVSPQILFQPLGRPHALYLYQKDLWFRTSAAVKVCERVVLCKLDSLVKDYIDPLQSVYRRNRGTDDVVLCVLENIHSHLEKKKERTGSPVWLMFFDFSSAFNTVQPHLLVQKLLNKKLPSSVIPWIFDYVTNRLRYVRLNGVLSICSLYKDWCSSRQF